MLIFAAIFFCGCASNGTKSNLMDNVQNQDFMNSTPDSDEEFYYLKFTTSYHENLDMNKSDVRYSLLPVKISEIAGGSLSSREEVSKEIVAGISFKIVPDDLWIDKNVDLINEYWDHVLHIYYSVFRISKKTINEFREYARIYTPVRIRNDMPFGLVLDEIAYELTSAIPNNSKIAVMNITMEDSNLSDSVYDELLSYLFDWSQFLEDVNYSIFERKSLDAIRYEQQFQLSGEVDDNTMIAIGKFIGADVIIIGGMSGMGQFRRFRIKAIDVKTAKIIIQLSYKI
jgi:hypothetical protein